jgi:hypothetical protein
MQLCGYLPNEGAMRVSGTKLANADRRLLASMNRDERWQQVKVPISSALWDVWGRYCEVAGISMGRGIAALIALDVQALADGQEEIEERGRLFDLREAELDSREHELDRRERELERREQNLGRRPSRAELERMANQIEPRDPGWSSATRWPSQDIPFEDVGRNDPCPCGSGLKYRRCHGSPSGPPST